MVNHEHKQKHHPCLSQHKAFFFLLLGISTVFGDFEKSVSTGIYIINTKVPLVYKNTHTTKNKIDQRDLQNRNGRSDRAHMPMDKKEIHTSNFMFSGLMSIFVIITMIGILRDKAIPKCSRVIFDTPIFAPTITKQ